ncbi:hypothetical protein RJ641_005743 [Dillenia turbinata]|uniref:Sororin C-terminal region domain-containing protein n=1 Tax=Dillenia turbinata TaxID=194707 RepID=A0AAN8ZDD5_9MAGN
MSIHTDICAGDVEKATMEEERKSIRKRKPLADCTNTISAGISTSSSSSTSLIKPSKSKSKTTKSLIPSSSVHESLSIPNPNFTSLSKNPENPNQFPSKSSSSVLGTGTAHSDKSKADANCSPGHALSIRNAKDKGKTAAHALPTLRVSDGFNQSTRFGSRDIPPNPSTSIPLKASCSGTAHSDKSKSDVNCSPRHISSIRNAEDKGKTAAHALPAIMVSDSFNQSTSIESSVAQNPAIPPNPSTPSLLKSSTSGKDAPGKSDPLTVYSRRHSAEKLKRKGKNVIEPLAGLPSESMKTISIGKESGDGTFGASMSCTIPRPKSKKMRRGSLPGGYSSTYTLPKDFIEKQRAYFAEIDAFELPVEVASDAKSLTRVELEG